jgi:pimeloyl-ACP methyl ester carboxylesterase
VKTWVLLRGLARERGHWGRFPQQLARELGVQVLPLDLPGNGARFRERTPPSVTDLAEDCREQLVRTGAAYPVGVLALSLGAMVAVQWAAAAPQEIGRLVLINTSLRPLCPPHWRLRPRAAATLLARLLAGDAQRLETAVLALTSARADPALLRDWLALRRAHPVTRANALRQLWAAARHRAPDAVAAPTLLLAGRGDRLVDHRCSERIAAAWRCRVAFHATAGHDLPIDDADWTIDQLRQWLAEDAE